MWFGRECGNDEDEKAHAQSSRDQPPNEQARQRIAVRMLAKTLATPVQMMKRYNVTPDVAQMLADGINRDLVLYDEQMRDVMTQAGNPPSGPTLREVAIAISDREERLAKQAAKKGVRK